jgi:hypothetical protein
LFFKNRTNGKLTEAEIAWLMNALTPEDCKSCIWQTRSDNFSVSLKAIPCKIFADMYFKNETGQFAPPPVLICPTATFLPGAFPGRIPA